jgi:hypothetical protein
VSGDKDAAIQMLAADNARLCDRLLTAEAIIDLVRRSMHTIPRCYAPALQRALDAHDAGKPS